MNLIGYSDSEDSGDDAPQITQPAAKPAPKPTFQKVVDRSKPGKIKLNLPSASQPQTQKDDIESEAPPAKKARLGGGAFGGFNAMLPAPKKPKVDAAMIDATSGKKALGKGLGVGVNLKTGAEPAFKRESKVDVDEYDETGNRIQKAQRKQEDFRALLGLPAQKSETKTEEVARKSPQDTGVPPLPVTQAPARRVFMPKGMGVPKKKKPVARPVAAPPAATQAGPANVPAVEQKPPPKPKVSLFGMSQEATVPTEQSTGEYQPLLYGTEQDDNDTTIPNSTFQSTTTASHPRDTPNGLTNIASELNLSAGERRQLFGRKGQGPDLSSAKIVEYNTDKEYAHNEWVRQQGETVQHNALKSISGTGKNSLRSLINVASTQKDALEEHFASGRRNKREAGSKYGW